LRIGWCLFEFFVAFTFSIFSLLIQSTLAPCVRTFHEKYDVKIQSAVLTRMNEVYGSPRASDINENENQHNFLQPLNRSQVEILV
jgi:hypothetical protein